MKRQQNKYVRPDKKVTVQYDTFTCEKCGKLIEDITQAVTDPVTHHPIHFDCAREIILKSETLGENDELAYLGKGTFGIVHFENPRNRKEFTIVKKIEFEPPAEDKNWRTSVQETFEKSFGQKQ